MVSIVVPVYNGKKVIGRCVESLIHQSYSDVEILLIDDGSTDGSGDICDKYAAMDERVRVHHQKNAGVSAARNKGISLAAGKYIQFIDSDDYMAGDMTQKLVEAIEKNKTSCAICGFLWLRDNEKRQRQLDRCGVVKLSELNEKCPNIFGNNILNPPWNKLFIKDRIKEGFDENLSLGEDLLFNLKYLDMADTVSFVEGTPYFYVDSLVGLSKKIRPENLKVAELLYNSSKEFVLKHQMGEKALGDVTRIFVKSSIYGCYDICVSRDISRAIKRKEIKKWLQMKAVQEAVSDVELENYQQRAAARLMGKQYLGLLMIFFRLKQLMSFVKNRR